METIINAELVKALSAFQAEMEPVTKNAQNPYFHSTYADLAAVWKAIKKLLTKHGFAVSQPLEPAEGGVVICTILMHEKGGVIVSRSFMPCPKFTAQDAGSAITYGRRYSLSAILGVVVEGEDDDAEGVMDRGENEPNRAKTTAARMPSPPPPDARKATRVAPKCPTCNAFCKPDGEGWKCPKCKESPHGHEDAGLPSPPPTSASRKKVASMRGITCCGLPPLQDEDNPSIYFCPKCAKEWETGA